jgi:hypothetical protein
MATAKIINNILKDEVIDVEVIGCKTVGDVVEKYVNENGYVGSVVECYDPETDTTTFIPLEDESNLSLSICVNNKDANLSTEIKEDDIITVIVLPAGGLNEGTKWGWGGGVLGYFIGSAIGAAIGFVAGGPWGALAGVIAGGVVGTIAGAVIGYRYYYDVIQPSKNKDSSYDKGLEGESTLGVRGSSNQSLVGNNYPVVLGKHLTTPFIVGSSYSTATGEYGIDQEIRVLYAVGYAPLKLTDFKLDSIMMAHNQSWKNNTDLKTIMHGKLSGVEDGDKGEITNSFYNNDIEIEILQQNPESDTIDYGTIYNQATIEKEIKATPLFIADKDLDEVAQTKYKGCRFPCYFRNNTVRFSQPCAKKVTLELQASSGLYKTWTHSSDSSSTTKYGSMPIWYAIQYRIYNKNNASSDAESGTGWTSFSSFNADTNHPVNAQVFTEAMRVADLDSHSGNSFSDDAKNTLNKNWVGELLFNFQDAFDTSDNQNNVSDMRFTGSVEFTLAECKEMLEVTDPAKIVEVRMIRVSPAYFDETSSSGNNGPVSYQDVITWNTVTTVKFDEEKLNEAISSDNTTTYQVLKNTYTRKVKNNQFTGYSKTSSQWITVTQDEYDTYKADLGNKHEYNFTEWDWVLLVQCEEDQPMHSEGYLNYWSYENLRIVSKEIGDEIPPLKPLSEDKMRKLCIVALKAKADAGGNIKNQLKKFTVMAEAFQPYVDLDTQEIFPKNVSKSVNYYYPNYYDDVQKEWVKGEQIEDTDTQTAKEIYEDLRLQGIKATAIKKGSDFVSQIDKLIFQDEFKDSSGRYFLNTDETSNIRKCNENNAISTALYWLIGPHAGADALDYSDIDLISAIEAFEDCNSVTDGSTYSKETTDEDGTVHQKGDLVKIKHCANTWLYKASKAEDVLANILVAGRSLYVRSESNKIRFIFDKEEEFPTMIVNQQNCLSHSITYSYEETPSGLIMEFPDEDDEYTTNTIYCMEDAEDSENPQKALESYNVSYCTNSYQTWSLGRYILANRVLNKKLLTAKVGWEGFNASIGSTVVVQLPTLLLGTDLGGRIKRLIEDDDYIYGFICDELFNYTGETEIVDEVEQSTQGVEIFQPCNKNKSNCIILRLCLPNTEIVVNETDDDGNVEEVHYKAEVGNTNVVIFANKISKADESVNGEASEILYYKPTPENIVNFGYVGSISETYRVTKIKADKDFNYDLTMLLYNPDIYNYGKALPTFQNHMTIPDRSGESYDLTNDLTLDVFTEKTTESTKSSIQKAVSDMTDYINNNLIEANSTKSPADVSAVSGIAEKDGVNLSAVAGGSTLYDNVREFRFEISKDAGTTWESVSGSYYSFNRTSDGYPEKSAFVNYKVRCKAVNSYGLISENWTEGTVTASTSYGTWILNAPTVTAKASEGKVEIAISDEVNANVWGYKSYSVTAGDYSDKITKVDEWNYTLDISGQYLEKADITAITFTATVKTEADSVTATCVADTSGYLSYIPTTAKMSISVSGRGVSINLSHDDFYEFTGYGLQISKDGSTWYSYGVDDTNRDNEDAWKGTLDEVTEITSGYKALYLALEGENNKDAEGNDTPKPTDTTYYLRVRVNGYSDTVTSDYVSQTIIARATWAKDIVENAVNTAQIAEGSVIAEKIYVDNLASINSVLGDVTAASISSNATEEGKPDPDNSTLYLNSESGNEEFYIGSHSRSEFVEKGQGTEGYEALWFHTLTSGVKEILFQISNFIVTSVSSIIKGLFKITDKSGNTFISVNPTDAVISGDTDATSAKMMKVEGELKIAGIERDALPGHKVAIETWDGSIFAKYVRATSLSAGGSSLGTATANSVTVSRTTTTGTLNATTSSLGTATADSVTVSGTTTTGTLNATTSSLGTATADSVTVSGTTTTGTLNATTSSLGTATADSVNNLIPLTNGLWGQTRIADLTNTSTFDTDTYYPVVCFSENQKIVHFVAGGHLGFQSGVSWSTHSSGGFYAQLSFETVGSNWGSTTKPIYLRYFMNEYVWCEKMPIYYRQLGYNNAYVFFLRGGAKYWISCSKTFSMTVYSTTYTGNGGQTASPTTTPSNDTGYIRCLNNYLELQTFSGGISASTLTTTGNATINGECTIGGKSAITGTTSTDSSGNLILNLYTN